MVRDTARPVCDADEYALERAFLPRRMRLQGLDSPSAGQAADSIGGNMLQVPRTLYSAHSKAVVPAQDGLCGVPIPFLSVTSLGRGFRLRYQIWVWPAVVDIGAAISDRMSATSSFPEYIWMPLMMPLNSSHPG